jgi:hypothetical protein
MAFGKSASYQLSKDKDHDLIVPQVNIIFTGEWELTGSIGSGN